MPPPEGGLLERTDEFAATEAAFVRADDGEGSIRMFEGEPGMGKTGLLEAARAIGTARGVQVLAATCRPPERDLTYGVVLQLFEQRLVQARPKQREHLLAGAAEAAGPLLLGHQARPHEGDVSFDHGLYWLCSNLAEDGPLALIVDDAGWADPATLQFFTYLAQRIRELPVVLILGCKSADSLGLRELAAHPATEVLQLAPLTPAAVGGLLRESLAGEVDEGFANACHHATGGNPFLLRELAQELQAGAIAPTSGAAPDVATIAPESITNSVLLRLRGIGDGALDLARAVAVLGGDAEVRHAAALAQIPQPEATEIADSLIEAGILAPGETLSFKHPISQWGVYRERSEPQRAEAHRQAALMLHSEQAAPEKMAGQLLSAATAGDRVVVDALLTLAAQATGRGDPDSAARLLDRALREPPEPDQRPLVVLALGRAEATAASPGAVDRLAHALELTDDPLERASVALEVSQLLVSLGRLEESLAALEGALAETESPPKAQRARLEAGVAATRRLLGRDGTAGTRIHLEVPQDAAETLAGKSLTAQLAYEKALEGRPVDEVSELAGRALAGGGLLKGETADGMSTYLAALALTMVEDFPAAEVVLDSAMEDARRRGSRLGYASASCYRGITLLSHGRLEEAAADLENCLAGQHYGWALALPGAHAALAECHIERGDLGGAERALTLGEETGQGSEALGRWRLLVGRGHLRLVTGRYKEGLDDLLEGGRRQELFGGVNPAIYPWRSLAAVAMAALGDREEGIRLAEEELRLVRAFGAPGAIGNTLRALGTVSATKDSLGTLEEAVRVLDGSGAELRRAQAYVDFGSALRRTGRRRDARAPLLEGLALSGRCGARSLARRAHSELIAAGGRPRRTSAKGIDALTPREQQTARLAAKGLSNRAIAESMFVTLKTVEWHLGNTYDKLGLSSRDELESILSTENV